MKGERFVVECEGREGEMGEFLGEERGGVRGMVDEGGVEVKKIGMRSGWEEVLEELSQR